MLSRYISDSQSYIMNLQKCSMSLKQLPLQSASKNPESHFVHLSPMKFPLQEHIPFESQDEEVEPGMLQLQSRKFEVILSPFRLISCKLNFLIS